DLLLKRINLWVILRLCLRLNLWCLRHVRIGVGANVLGKLLWSNIKSAQNMRNSLLRLHIHIAKKLAEAFRWGLCKLSLDTNIVIECLFNANTMAFTELFVFLKIFTELMRFTVLLHLSLMFTYK